MSCEAALGCNIFVRPAAPERERWDEGLPLSGGWRTTIFQSGAGGLERSSGNGVAHFAPRRARRERGFFGAYAQIANSYYLWQKGIISSFGKLIIAFWLPTLRISVAGVLRRGIHRNSLWNLVLDDPGRVLRNVWALLDPPFSG